MPRPVAKRTILSLDLLRQVRLPLPPKAGRAHQPKTVYRHQPKHRRPFEDE